MIIRGTRHILPSHRVAPRPGVVTVELLTVLEPKPGDRDAAVHLRDEARRVLLNHLGEPDLSNLTGTEVLLGETA
jgi:hypothetical protein